MQDFMRALQEAQTLPDAPDSNSPIPDLLKGDNFAQTVRTIMPGTPGKVPNATEYDFIYKCARLQIGKEMIGFSNGQAEFSDIDETDRLQEIMNMSLAGEAVITKKIETFLKDGTVVIFVEWMEPKSRTSKKDRDFLTTSELLSPELRPPDDESSEDLDSDPYE